MVEMNKNTEEMKVNSIHLLTHPIRYKILETIRSKKRAMFSQEIADELKINPRLISFHLAVLQKEGNVTGEWKVSVQPRSKGKAAKYYQLTPETESILSECKL